MADTTNHIQLLLFKGYLPNGHFLPPLVDLVNKMGANERLVEYRPNPAENPKEAYFFKAKISADGSSVVMTDEVVISVDKQKIAVVALEKPISVPNPKADPNGPPIRHPGVILKDDQEKIVRSQLDAEVKKHSGLLSFNDHVKSKALEATGNVNPMEFALTDGPNGPTPGGPANDRPTSLDVV